MFTCEGVVRTEDLDCHICDCPKRDNCVCEECGTPFDPNGYKKCKVPSCGRLFPTHKNYKGKHHVSNKEGIEKATEKETAEMTTAKLEKKRDLARLRETINNPRGVPAPMLKRETSCVEVVNVLSRVSTSCASADSALYERRPFDENFTAPMSYAMIVKASRGLFGSMSKGRLSLWQFQKGLGAHSRNNYYDMNQAGQRQMSTRVQWSKLGSTSLVIAEFK